MTERPRYVFDTGVIVSAALFKESTPGLALRAALRMGDLLLSPATVQELQQVLARPKFDHYLQISTRRRFLAALVRRSCIIDANLSFQICRDPRDNKFLELAVGGQASHLITGDDDLLVLNPFQGIPVVTAAEFLKIVTG
jgi:putative PIN family toxin of toxin-antitoxin system